MDSRNSKRDDILKMIENHQISAEDGFKLLKVTGFDRNKHISRKEKSAGKMRDTQGIAGNNLNEIAIIGMSGRFPGASNVEEFWNKLSEGADCITEVPKDRWDVDKFYDPNPDLPNKTYSKWGGFLDDIDKFDPSFFNISPVEAELMDPQQRLFLEEAWKGFEDAGYSDKSLSSVKCGVFVGASYGDYTRKLDTAKLGNTSHSFTGLAPSILASRISYFLNLIGPSIVLDTACSSSLVAIRQACQSLLTEESDIALAGGVVLMLTPDLLISTSKARMLSPTGKCKTFDQDADGIVISEGVGVVVLKPLQKAIEDRNSIYGVIKASKINQDGKTNGITAPSARSQTRLELEVYQQAKINPDTISYVETHGTGTLLGDPIEVKALKDSFKEYTQNKQFCALGSVKTNIGHTTMAAGVASVIKVLLALKYKKIPPSINFRKENMHINLDDSPFYVNTELKEWKEQPGHPRRAAISSFGFSGTNCHMVIEEAPHPEASGVEGGKPYYMVALSAKTETALHRKLEDLAHWLSGEGVSHSIADVAYTHHIGRSHFEKRSAFVIKDTETLQQSLRLVLEKGNSPDFVRLDLETAHLQSGVLLKDVGNRLIGDLASGGLSDVVYKEKLLELAGFYVNSDDFDWEQLYGGETPRRISMPTYPFERERYWVPESGGRGLDVSPVISGNAGRLHPMIEQISSTLNVQRFTTHITGDEFYLKDHLIAGQNVVPGVVTIEMARAAGEISQNSKVKKIKNITWSKPIAITQTPLEVSLNLRPVREGAEYELTTSGKEGQAEIHTQGKLVYVDEEDITFKPEFMDVEGIKKRCQDVKEGEACYKLFEAFQINHGTNFQAIQKLYCNESEALSSLKLPGHLISSFKDYVLHPSLIDSSLQTVIGLLSYSEIEMGTPYLPFFLGEVDIIKPLSENGYAYVRLAGNQPELESGIKKYDICFLDENGQVLVKMREFTVRPLFNKQKRNPYKNYYNIWNKSDLDSNVNYCSLTGCVLIFDMDSNRYDVLKDRLNKVNRDIATEKNLKIILVKPGDNYQKVGDQAYEVNPQNNRDYTQLVKALKEHGDMPDKIIHLWSWESFDGKEESLKHQLDMGVYSVFYLIQALMKQRPGSLIRFLYVYSFGMDGVSPQYAATGGLLKSVRLENPGFLSKIMGIDTECRDSSANNSIQLWEMILSELASESGDNIEIRYEAGQRWEKGIKEFDLTRSAMKTIPGQWGVLREKGVYLITGGLGGLGLIFAQYLARQFKAKLALVGRSDLNETMQIKKHELEEYGSEVIYVKADISNKEDVDRLLREVKSQFKVLNGIIHAAGVKHDSFVLKKTESEMSAVLAAKVFGTVYLDEATRNENLDFYVLFSSIASVMGNVGQCDYAYANSFMDNFALMRDRLCSKNIRSGKTLSINWPLWKNGGMRVNAEVEKLFTGEFKIQPMDSDTGLQIFVKGLASTHNQFMVSTDSLQDKGLIKGLKEREHSINVIDHPGTVVRELHSEMQEKAERFLMEMLSETLKLPLHKINPKDPLEKYGIDSVLVLSLTKELEDRFGELSKTLFFEYQTIAELATYFIENHPEKLSQKLERIPGDYLVEKERLIPKGKEDVGTGRFVEVKKELHQKQMSLTGEIAIIGMSGRYPLAQNLDQFWTNLKNGRDCITEIPRERWDYHRYYDPDRNKFGKTYTKWGGFIQDVDKFDPLFFNIAPREAEMLDPQERLFLEVVWQTLEDAGYTRDILRQTGVGVFVGVMWGHYQIYGVDEVLHGRSLASTSSFASIANRVSYYFDFHGPSIALDTMCSSSLTAIHMACESIRHGECDVAIAGGVNVSIHPVKYFELSQMQLASSDGRCRSFGEGGDGYVPGEGVGALLLKPLERAISDRDHIYGVLKGSSLNHGGKTNGYTVPNPKAQGELIQKALQKAGVEPDTISYLEAHGTGTSLGDPVEINGLMRAYQGKVKIHSCSIGSVKSNIGHLESAAGIAAVTKVLLQMKNRQLVPSIHTERLNPNINFDKSPFYVQRELGVWEQPVIKNNGALIKFPRRAGISAFGAGGANAHVILEEYEAPLEIGEQNVADGSCPCVIVISARNEDRLKVYVENLELFLRNSDGDKAVDKPTFFLTDVAYTLQVGREAMSERLALVVSSIKELVEVLADYCLGKINTANLFRGNVKSSSLPTELLVEGEEGIQFLRGLVRDRKWVRLAQLWVSGVTIEWELLYTGITPHRISLPTYPFEKKRYWIMDNINGSNGISGKSNPLIDGIEPGLSMSTGLVFKKKFRGTDLIVHDHNVCGLSIMPGVGYLEMVYEAAAMVNRRSQFSLIGNVWLQPLEVGEDEKSVQIVLKEDGGHVHYEVRSGTTSTIVHARGMINYNGEVSGEQGQSVSVEEIKARCPHRVGNDEFYGRFCSLGLEYGSYFQGVEEIWVNKTEALSKLKLPVEYLDELNDYTLHPTLMDGAMQTIAVLIGGISGNVCRPMLPFSVEEVEVLRPLKADSYAYIKEAEKEKYHVAILDESGRVCVKLHEVSLREIKDPLRDFFYIPGWKQSSLRSVQTGAVDVAILIYSSGSNGLVKALKQAHSEAEVFEIKLGSENRRYSDRKREINAGDPLAMDSCIGDISDMSKSFAVYFLGGIQTQDVGFDDLVALERIQEFGVISLFRLIKSLKKHGFVESGSHRKGDGKSGSLKVVTNDVHGVMSEERTRPYSAGLHGLCKSMAREYPWLDISCIDISLEGMMVDSSKDEYKALMEPVFVEPGHRNGEDVAIRDGRRYVRTMERVHLPPVKDIPFRRDGVYLILGGAGGIGLELSEYLAETVKARLVLLGRSELGAEQKAKITRIESMGGKVLYLRADATDEESMKAAVEKAKSHYGSINGVFHSAIVLRDKTIEKMDEETFTAALAPKVMGSVVLHKVIRGEELDFMIYFSSVQSFTGNAGQSNYAAGCTFKDAFARYLNRMESYPVKIINWGYWGGVGVVATDEYRKIINAQGIGSITSSEGMEAIRRVLAHRVDQVIAIKAKKEVLTGAGVDLEVEVEIKPECYPSVIEDAAGRVSLPKMETGRIAEFRKMWVEIEQWSHCLLLNAFQRLGVFHRGGEIYKNCDLRERLELSSGYERLYDALLDILTRAGFIELKGDTVRSLGVLDEADFQNELKVIEDRKNDLAAGYSELGAYIDLLWGCLSRYPEVLKGEIAATDVLFPNSSTELVGRVYKGNVAMDYFNELVAWSVLSFIESRQLLLKDGERIRILEVGAGTGGTSVFVLEAIRNYGDRLEYVYTDISPHLIQYGKREYGDKYPFVSFKELDLEKDVEGQGYESGEFDVVIASNVLHATRRLEETLHRVKYHLKRHGWLVLNEPTEGADFLTLTFGLLGGWWLFEDRDRRLPCSPLVSLRGWDCLLREVGFERVCTYGQEKGSSPGGQEVICAESNGMIRRRVKGKTGSPVSAPLRTTSTGEEVKRAVSGADVALVSRVGERVDDRQQRVADQDYESKRDRVTEVILSSVSGVLQIDEQEFDLDAPYTDFGVDSISAVEIINRVNDSLGIQLKTTDLFNYSTIRMLIEHVIGKFDVILESRIKAPVKPLELFRRSRVSSLKKVDYFPLSDSNMKNTEMMSLLRKLEKGDLNPDEVLHYMEKNNGQKKSK